MPTEIHDPYKTITEREQDLLHQRELERIKLSHDRRLKVIEFIGRDWPFMSLAFGVGAGILALAMVVPSCREGMNENKRRTDELIDTCIREGTNPESCRCAYDWNQYCD